MNVFAVGDLNVDLFTVEPEKFTFGEEHRTGRIYVTLGGNAANFAAALSSLKVETRLVSALGNDLYTGFLLRELKRHGVKPLLSRQNAPNGVSNILVRKDGERAIVSCKGALLGLDVKTVRKKILPRLREGDIVCFGGFFHLPKMRMGFPELLGQIRVKGGLVIFDTTFDEYGKWNIGSFARHVDYIFTNTAELQKITRTRGLAAGAKRLLAMGTGKVVVKMGARGAAFFSNGVEKSVPALPVKAYNSTGAGDSFNAGFVYSLAKGFSAKNCLLCGSFAAAKRVEGEGFALANEKELRRFLGKRNLAEVEVVKNYSAMSKRAADIIIRQLHEKPGSVLCLAAGKTPLGTYSRLVRAHREGLADFSAATFIQLDEYLCSEEKDSFGHLLKKHLLGEVNFRTKNIFLFNRDAGNLGAECRRLDFLVKRKGIDLLLLGIGENGHIAFNEPGTGFNSNTHALKLTPGLLARRAKKFSGPRPARAITLGLRQVMAARKIVLLASGRKKKRAVRGALRQKPSPALPASILQMHPNAIVVSDKAAGMAF